MRSFSTKVFSCFFHHTLLKWSLSDVSRTTGFGKSLRNLTCRFEKLLWVFSESETTVNCICLTYSLHTVKVSCDFRSYALAELLPSKLKHICIIFALHYWVKKKKIFKQKLFAQKIKKDKQSSSGFVDEISLINTDSKQTADFTVLCITIE